MRNPPSVTSTAYLPGISFRETNTPGGPSGLGVQGMTAGTEDSLPSSIASLMPIFVVAPATGAEPVSTVALEQEIPQGTSTIRADLQVGSPRPWQLNDPCLYRATGRIKAAGSSSAHETSARFGFRDFRFADGYFRLNGRRVLWRFAHTGADTPGTIRVPYDPGLLRRDLLNAKVMGFNAIRFIAGVAKRYQLDLCDEIGLMVYEEAYASWCLADSPQMAERFDESILGMVRRDRNHPSVTMWGLLNETPDGPVFRHAISVLPALRQKMNTSIIPAANPPISEWKPRWTGIPPLSR